MKTYEYKAVFFPGSSAKLTEINELAAKGWRVVEWQHNVALMEREIEQPTVPTAKESSSRFDKHYGTRRLKG